MIKAERHNRILAELAKRGAISGQELAALLDASLATVRRDIAELDRRSAVVRTHGGAELPRGSEELPFDAKVMAFLPEKRRIAAYAASLLTPGCTVGCGGGTTVMQMVPTLKRLSLKLVTNAINVALELRDAPGIEVLLTGGTLRSRTAELVGHVAERTLADVNLDVAIIGIDGIEARGGLSTYDASEAYANRALIGRAREVWIVADHSKFGRVLPAVVAPVQAATRIVTDTGAAAEITAAVERLGAEVVRV